MKHESPKARRRSLFALEGGVLPVKCTPEQLRVVYNELDPGAHDAYTGSPRLFIHLKDGLTR